MDELLSVAEAARRLGGISPWTIHAWLSQGKLKRTKIGSRTMIRSSELEKVIKDGGKSPAPKRERSRTHDRNVGSSTVSPDRRLAHCAVGDPPIFAVPLIVEVESQNKSTPFPPTVEKVRCPSLHFTLTIKTTKRSFWLRQ